MTTADTIAKLEHALDRAYMHECPGNPESPEKPDPCRYPALQHMTDRVTVIFTRVASESPVTVVPLLGESTFRWAPVFTVIIGGAPSATAAPYTAPSTASATTPALP